MLAPTSFTYITPALHYLIKIIIIVTGDTLTIPDSVMGLTFLAAGTSVPEAVSSIIVTKQGKIIMFLHLR